MKHFILATLFLFSCVPIQTAVEHAAEPECPEPPPPPPAPSIRAAGAYFEISDIGKWADGLANVQPPPPISEIAENIGAMIEATLATERAAAELRAYDIAESARMNVEELIIRLIELGVTVTPEQRRMVIELDEDDPIEPFDDPIAEAPTVLEDMAVLSLDVHDMALQIAEIEARTAPEHSTRAQASCLATRLGAYLDLEDITQMLEEDVVGTRIEVQQGENVSDLAELDRLLIVASELMNGCRRGGQQAVEAAGRVFTVHNEIEDDLADLQEIAQEVAEACRAVSTENTHSDS